MVVLLQVFSWPRGVPVGVERWDCECECECEGGCWGSGVPALLLRMGMASLWVVVCVSTIGRVHKPSKSIKETRLPYACMHSYASFPPPMPLSLSSFFFFFLLTLYPWTPTTWPSPCSCVECAWPSLWWWWCCQGMEAGNEGMFWTWAGGRSFRELACDVEAAAGRHQRNKNPEARGTK